MRISSSRAASSPSPSDRLRVRLRAEALADSPAFSPELHQRALSVLRANGLKGLSGEAQEDNSRWRIVRKIATPLAIAAAVAIAAWIVFKPAPAPQNQPDNIADYMPSAPSPADLAQNVAHDLGLPTEDSLDQAKFGYLDKDAQRLASFVADQLPTFGLTDDSPNPPSPQ